VKSLNKDPFACCLTKKDLRRLLNTMDPNVPVTYYQERGDEIDGIRVVVPKKLKSLVKNTGGLDSPVKDRLLSQDARLIEPEGYEIVYDNYGKDPKSGKSTFK
jgi:hypothetical protein